MRLSRCAFLLLIFLLPGVSLSSQSGEQDTSPQSVSSGNALELHLGSGYELLREEKYPEAEKELRAALAIDPSLALRARFPLGVALFEQHKNVEARRELEIVRRDAGDQPGIYYYLGRIDLSEQNYKSAMENLGKASEHPPFPDTAFYLGIAYLQAGFAQEAEIWLKKATEMNPADSRAEYELAKLYRKQGRDADARKAFGLSEELKARSDKLSQLKYECGRELDRTSQESTPVCDQLYDPNDAELLTALGILYGQHGELEKALKPLQRAAELAPRSPQIQYNLAYTYYQLRRFQEARRALEPAAQQWPDLYSVSALYGAVLWNLGDTYAAYETLEHAHKLNSRDASTTSLLYQCTLQVAAESEKAAQDSDALRYLEEAAALAPTEPEPHRLMGAIYRRIGQPGQAKTEEQKAEEIAGAPKITP
ncbi:MAG TPA: tetratricopeptide repeat protein [Terriglobales bacterium]|nr:tetratricopeptide repeat protein [Terriglobales bacterium]